MAAPHSATPQIGGPQNGVLQGGAAQNNGLMVNGGSNGMPHGPGSGEQSAAQNSAAQFGYVAAQRAQGGPTGPNGNPPVGLRGPMPGPAQVPGAGPSQFQQLAGPPDPRSRDPYGPQSSVGYDVVSIPVQGGFGPEQGFGSGALQPAYQASGPPLPAVRVQQPVAIALPEAVKAAHAEGYTFGESVGRDAPGLWLEAVLARKPRMPSDLEARLLQGSVLPIDSLLHDEVRHSLRRGFWDALESARR